MTILFQINILTNNEVLRQNVLTDKKVLVIVVEVTLINVIIFTLFFEHDILTWVTQGCYF